MNPRIQSALSYIPADDRETWLQMAMAIRYEVGDEGFDMWDQWSSTADNYNAAAARSVWKSCRGSGITLGTLFHEAKARGWRDDEKHASAPPALLQARKLEAQARQTQEGQERERLAQAAAKKAGWILHQTLMEEHAYLHRKGWPEARGNVWHPDEEQNLLCIPMRIGDALVGLQMIDRDGGKRYLSGQRTSEAEHVISNNGRGAADWFCEGYATGLSLRECLHALRLRYRIHITFSAGNLAKVAAKYGTGYVVADRDESGTGERAAQKTGLPYWISDVNGEDLNDAHKRLGLFGCSQMLRKWLLEASSTVKMDEPPKHLRCDGGSKQTTCTRGLHA